MNLDPSRFYHMMSVLSLFGVKGNQMLRKELSDYLFIIF